MTKSDAGKQPAQVPGDAESPPTGEIDPTAERAVRQIDATEPVPSGQKEPGRKPS
jgi:hypothetical protein